MTLQLAASGACFRLFHRRSRRRLRRVECWRLVRQVRALPRIGVCLHSEFLARDRPRSGRHGGATMDSLHRLSRLRLHDPARFRDRHRNVPDLHAKPGKAPWPPPSSAASCSSRAFVACPNAASSSGTSFAMQPCRFSTSSACRSVPCSVVSSSSNTSSTIPASDCSRSRLCWSVISPSFQGVALLSACLFVVHQHPRRSRIDQNRSEIGLLNGLASGCRGRPFPSPGCAARRPDGRVWRASYAQFEFKLGVFLLVALNRRRADLSAFHEAVRHPDAHHAAVLATCVPARRPLDSSARHGPARSRSVSPLTDRPAECAHDQPIGGHHHVRRRLQSSGSWPASTVASSTPCSCG